MSEVDRLLGQPFLGGYVITRKIGEGGMGAVYLAENPELQTRWAVKVLLPERSSSASAVARFKAEARAASRIRHRNIIAIQDMGELADGRHYITMEYLEGTTLRRYARGLGRMPVDVTLAILAQVCAGLQAAHEQGIIHRDLKPSNIFVAPQPDNPYFTKLLDFGIAKLSDRNLAGEIETKSQTVAGTPNYMSPEQARALRDVDHRTDIYAVGCIAYELLTGRLPYRAHSVGDLVYQQASQAPQRPGELRPDLPEAWDELIWRAIDLEKERRPQSAQELAGQMIDATPRGMDVAKACASLLFTTMSDSGSGVGSDPLAAISSAPPSQWSQASVPNARRAGPEAAPPAALSHTESVQKEADDFDFARFPGAEDEEETRAASPSARSSSSSSGDFDKFPGGEDDGETRAASPVAMQRSRSQFRSRAPGGTAAPAAAGSAPSPSGAAPVPPAPGAPDPGMAFPGAFPPPPGAAAPPPPYGYAPNGGTPTTLGFSASEKSRPGVDRARRPRRSLGIAAGITAAVVAVAVVVFLLVVRAPSGVEPGSPGAESSQAAPEAEGEAEAETEGEGERPDVEPDIEPLAVEVDAAVEEEERSEAEATGERKRRDRGRRGEEKDAPPKDPEELFEMRK